MAKIDIKIEDGSVLGNPAVDNYFVFFDSNNSDLLTTRDSTGTDTTYVAGAGNYFKDEVLITSGSITGSASDQAVPSLNYTIPAGKAGNYVVYAVLSVDIDNSDMKPLSIMLYKNTVKETNSVTMDFAKKNENQSVQLTFAMDGLLVGDLIEVFVNNDNEDINTIITGRILMQKFE